MGLRQFLSTKSAIGSSDKINYLKEFLYSHLSNTNEKDWEQYTTDFISGVLSFSNSELQQFLKEMLTWEDDALIKIADPLLFAIHKNFPFRDRVAVYGKIFLKVKDLLMLHFLSVNIHVIAHISPRKEPLEFYTAITEKVRELTLGGYQYMEVLEKKIELEKKNKPMELDDIPEKVRRIYPLHISTDKVKRMYEYMLIYENDIDDTWEYIHDPKLKDHINTFTSDECKLLEEELQHWDSKMLYNFADAVAKTTNKFLDGKAIYCDICFRVEDPDDFEYLIQNFPLFFTSIRPGSRSVGYYENIKSRLSDLGYVPLFSIVDQKIEEEKCYREMKNRDESEAFA